MKRWKRNIL